MSQAYNFSRREFLKVMGATTMGSMMAPLNCVAKYFNKLPRDMYRKLLKINYSRAEQNCPQQMAIGKLIGEAFAEFS
jgi:hypothetical protein